MRRPFLFWGFKSSPEVLENSLGALEREVMAIVWDRGEVNVRDTCARLSSPVAYTTVMTTMDRLFKKGLLARRKVGRAFVYRATATKENWKARSPRSSCRAFFSAPAARRCRFCHRSSTRCRSAIARCSTNWSG